MSRAKSARSKVAEEIPLATRSSPKRPLSTKQVSLIAITTILLVLIAIGVTRSIFPDTFIFNDLTVDKSFSKKNGRLLGHFPYPEVATHDLIQVYPGLSIHLDTYKSLKLMRNAASADGINLILLSGYRSHELQRQIFYGRKSARNQIAIERAKVSAPPGYSEHSTGYAIDLGDSTRRDTDFEETFESTPAFFWLKNNAARYHFVLSFPKGNLQGVSYEPWHWRYEGTVDALKQFEDANEFRRTKELLRPSY